MAAHTITKLLTIAAVRPPALGDPVTKLNDACQSITGRSRPSTTL